MANVRLKTITIESSPLLILGGETEIVSKLICNGGVGIINTNNSSSPTVGGSLTINGGLGINKDVYLYSNLTLEKDSVFSIKNALVSDQSQFIIKDGNDIKLNLTETSVSISNLIVTGGVSIHSTQSRSLLINGGVSIQKKLISQGINASDIASSTLSNLVFSSTNSKILINHTGANTSIAGRLGVSTSTIGNKILLYNNISFGVDETELKYNIGNGDNTHVFYSNENELACIVGDGYVGINTTMPSMLLDVNGEIGFNNNSTSLYNNSNVKYKTTTTSLLKGMKYTNVPIEWYKKDYSFSFDSISLSSKLNLLLGVNNDFFYTSADSILWNSYARPSVPVNYTINSMQKSKTICIDELQIFVVFSIYNRVLPTRTDLVIHYSSDGYNWNSTIVNNIVLFNSVCWSADLMTCVVVVKNNLNVTTLLKSVDIINWQTINHSIANLKTVDDMCWSSERFEFMGMGQLTNDTFCTITSYNLVDWTSNEQTSYTTTHGYRVIWCSEFGLYIGLISNVSNTEYKIVTSKDGIIWDIKYNSSSKINDIGCSFETNVFIASTNTDILVSYDTIGWSPQLLSSILPLKSIFWLPGFSKFLILSDLSMLNSSILKPSTKSVVLYNPSYLTTNRSNGNVGINNTSPQYKLHVSGDVLVNSDAKVSNELSVLSLQFINGQLNSGQFQTLNVTGGILSSNANLGNVTTENLVSTNITSNIVRTNTVTTGNMATNSLDVDNIRITDVNVKNNATMGQVIVDNNGSNINITSGTVYFNSNGVILNGSGRVSDEFKSENCVINGNVSIQNTSTSLSITGGMNVKKQLDVNGQGILKDDVLFKGGMEIKTPLNGMTVLGGASILKNLYVGGALMTGVLHTLSINIANTDSDSLSCLGGITINCTQNSSSISNGGALLVRGGMTVQKDILLMNNILKTVNYISGTDILTKKITFNTTSSSTEITAFSTENKDLLLMLGNDEVLRFKSDSQVKLTSVPALAPVSPPVLIKGQLGMKEGIFVGGGTSIQKTMYIGGDTVVNSTRDSITHGDGSFVISGGVGVNKNVGVNGNMVVLGNLSVNSELVHIDTNNITVVDNLMLIKAVNTDHSGFISQRFQNENDTGTGDVVNESDFISFVLPNQSVLGPLIDPTNTILFPSDASSVNDYYKGWWIKVNSGFRAGQTRKIVSYDGSTRIATLSAYWNVNNPSMGDTVYIYNKPYVGVIFEKDSNAFHFVNSKYTTLYNTGSTGNAFVEPISFQKFRADSVELGKNLVLVGGIGIFNSSNSTSYTSGGALTSLGGGSVNKDLYIGGNLHIQNNVFKFTDKDILGSVYFSSNNLSDVISNVTFLKAQCFDLYIVVRVVKTTGKDYCFLRVRGINIDSEWTLAKTYMGDDIGINFNINMSDQLEYSIPSIPDFLSVEFKCKMFNV